MDFTVWYSRAPNHSVLNIFDFKILNTPIIYLVDALIMEYEDFQNYNNLFIVFTENNKLLSQRTIFYHSKSIVRHGMVMVWNVDAKQGSDSNHFQSIFELFWKKSILQVSSPLNEKVRPFGGVTVIVTLIQCKRKIRITI